MLLSDVLQLPGSSLRHHGQEGFPFPCQPREQGHSFASSLLLRMALLVLVSAALS